MINSTEIKYRNNVPFNAQTVPLSQGGQPVYAPAMQGIQDSYVSNRVKKAEYGWASIPIGVCGLDFAKVWTISTINFALKTIWKLRLVNLVLGVIK